MRLLSQCIQDIQRLTEYELAFSEVEPLVNILLGSRAVSRDSGVAYFWGQG